MAPHNEQERILSDILGFDPSRSSRVEKSEELTPLDRASKATGLPKEVVGEKLRQYANHWNYDFLNSEKMFGIIKHKWIMTRYYDACESTESEIFFYPAISISLQEDGLKYIQYQGEGVDVYAYSNTESEDGSLTIIQKKELQYLEINYDIEGSCFRVEVRTNGDLLSLHKNTHGEYKKGLYVVDPGRSFEFEVFEGNINIRQNEGDILAQEFCIPVSLGQSTKELMDTLLPYETMDDLATPNTSRDTEVRGQDIFSRIGGRWEVLKDLKRNMSPV